MVLFTWECESMGRPVNKSTIVIPVNSDKCLIVFEFYFQQVTYILGCQMGRGRHPGDERHV